MDPAVIVDMGKRVPLLHLMNRKVLLMGVFTCKIVCCICKLQCTRHHK